MTESTPAPEVVARRSPVTRAQFQADALLAGGLLVSAILSGALGAVAGFYGGDGPALGWTLAQAAAVALPLALRRHFPCTVVVVVSIAFFVGVSLRIPEVYIANIAVFIAIYTVGAWVDDRRRATLVRVLVIASMFIWLLVTTFREATAPTDDTLSRVGAFSPFVAFMLIQFLINAAFFGGAYYMGDRAHASALERKVLEERTSELEREREITAAQAVALDRVRLASELHDVVAHHVSAMGVQAGAARTVLDRDPHAAKRALKGIEDSARSALTDLRNLLETLRRSEATAPAGASTLRLDDIADLVAHARAHGLPTEFTIIGDPIAAPEIVQVNLYRIAQESLTNARRHAGPGATADVRLRYAQDGIELEISNSGRPPLPSRRGLGIIGMRERAAASGGTIELGPRARGGFLVRIHVPLRETAGADR